MIFSGLVIITGCKNNDLKKDADQIGDIMCRNIEIAGKLRIANPNDTAAISKLQRDSQNLQTEMTKMYADFKKKYGDKVNDKEFSKKFSNELRRAMLNCPHLSKQDREQFEKDLAE